MSEPKICPICGGSGKVPSPDANPNSLYYEPWITCHGCGGKGWVEVS